MSARTLNDNPERNPSMTIESQVTATARDAGRNVVHTVSAVRNDGQAVKVYRDTRRSASTRYAYAICRWTTVDGERAVIVDRWSKNAKATGASFAVRVQDVAR